MSRFRGTKRESTATSSAPPSKRHKNEQLTVGRSRANNTRHGGGTQRPSQPPRPRPQASSYPNSSQNGLQQRSQYGGQALQLQYQAQQLPRHQQLLQNPRSHPAAPTPPADTYMELWGEASLYTDDQGNQPTRMKVPGRMEEFTDWLGSMNDALLQMSPDLQSRFASSMVHMDHMDHLKLTQPYAPPEVDHMNDHHCESMKFGEQLRSRTFLPAIKEFMYMYGNGELPKREDLEAWYLQYSHCTAFIQSVLQHELYPYADGWRCGRCMSSEEDERLMVSPGNLCWLQHIKLCGDPNKGGFNSKKIFGPFGTAYTEKHPALYIGRSEGKRRFLVGTSFGGNLFKALETVPTLADQLILVWPSELGNPMWYRHLIPASITKVFYVMGMPFRKITYFNIFDVQTLDDTVMIKRMPGQPQSMGDINMIIEELMARDMAFYNQLKQFQFLPKQELGAGGFFDKHGRELELHREILQMSPRYQSGDTSLTAGDEVFGYDGDAVEADEYEAYDVDGGQYLLEGGDGGEEYVQPDAEHEANGMEVVPYDGGNPDAEAQEPGAGNSDDFDYDNLEIDYSEGVSNGDEIDLTPDRTYEKAQTSEPQAELPADSSQQIALQGTAVTNTVLANNERRSPSAQIGLPHVSSFDVHDGSSPTTGSSVLSPSGCNIGPRAGTTRDKASKKAAKGATTVANGLTGMHLDVSVGGQGVIVSTSSEQAATPSGHDESTTVDITSAVPSQQLLPPPEHAIVSSDLHGIADRELSNPEFGAECIKGKVDIPKLDESSLHAFHDPDTLDDQDFGDGECKRALEAGKLGSSKLDDPDVEAADFGSSPDIADPRGITPATAKPTQEVGGNLTGGNVAAAPGETEDLEDDSWLDSPPRNTMRDSEDWPLLDDLNEQDAYEMLHPDWEPGMPKV